MKYKFKAEAKDILVLIIFSIFLMIVVSLGVVNISHMINQETLAGLNPIPGFLPPYLPITLGISLLILLGTFLSVQKTFFEKEKGFGFSVGKKSSDGYSKWSSEKEMKEDLDFVDPQAKDSDKAGTPIILKKNEIYVDDGESHTLVIGATGSGKTQCIVLPLVKILAKARESMVITDPKGEIYETTGNLLKKRGYNLIVLNFRNPQKGNAWNPMGIPYDYYQEGNKDKAVELLDDLAVNVLHEEKVDDPFWQNTAGDYFTGLAQAIFENGTKKQANISSISYMDSVGGEKRGGSTYMDEFLKLQDKTSSIYANLSGTVNAPADTQGSIITTFKQKVKIFSSRENLSEMLSHSDFDMADIGRKPTAVFLIVHDEKTTYHSLATTFIKQCYEKLIDVAFENGGALPVRTNFILDEFANMPNIKDVDTMITAARSRRIRMTLIIQNFAQLNQTYGKELAETIKGNCGNIVYLLTTELQALEELSKLFGEVKSKADDKTASTPLVTISDLQKLKKFDAIIKRLRMDPFKTSFTPDFKMDWGRKFPRLPFPERQKEEVQLFDIKEFVKTKKKEKIDSMNKNPAFMIGDKLSLEDKFFNKKSSSEEENNIEKLVAKIDKRLQEIEEEEKRDKEEELKIEKMNENLEKEDDTLPIIKPKVKYERVTVPLKDSFTSFVEDVENSKVDSRKVENRVNEKISKGDDFLDDLFE